MWARPRIEVVYVGPRGRKFFSDEEVRHLAIGGGAVFGMMAIADAALLIRAGALSPLLLAILLGVDAASVATAFLLHELAHKVAARRYGAWAEFRHSPPHILAFGFLLSVFGFLFAMPGAVVTAGNFTRRQNGIVSAVGPVTNLGLAMAFLVPYLLAGNADPLLRYSLRSLLFLNAWLGFFNMLPLKFLFWNDGMKVWEWNKGIYLALMAPLAALSLLLLIRLL